SLRFHKKFKKIHSFAPLFGVLVCLPLTPKIWGGDAWFSMFGICCMVGIPVIADLIYGDDVKNDVKNKQVEKQKSFKKASSLTTSTLLTYAQQQGVTSKNQEKAIIWQKLKLLAEQEKLYASQWKKLSPLLDQEIKKTKNSSIEV